MATYKIRTKRYIRKYTAAEKLPVSAALIDAQRVVDELCNVPWEQAAATTAVITSHDESELDANVSNRDRFDAALFCADHANGAHRAYANAACYKIPFPTGTAGKKVTSLKVRVTSDAYNAAGARIALVTNSTGVIPTSCAECRGEGSGGIHAAGVAPQTIQTVGGQRYGYPTIADCIFNVSPGEGEYALPTGGLTLGSYLYVFVLMENYNSVRGNWLEGSSCIVNQIEIVTDSAITGWTDGALIDLTGSTENELKIVKDGILPYIPGSAPVGEVHVAVRTDANPIIEDDGSQTPVRPATGDKAAAAIGRLFSAFYEGKSEIPLSTSTSTSTSGAAFNITRTTEPHVTHDSDRPVDTDVLRIDSAALVVPFVFPRDFTPVRVVLTLNSQLSTLNLSPGARFNVFLADGYLTSLTEEQLKNPGLYDGEGAPFTLLGTIDSTTDLSTPQHLNLTTSHSRFGTIVITGYFPPDRFDLVTGGQQGTGPIPFLPDISITD